MKMKNNEVILCCGGKGCPKLSKNTKGMIEIKDDFGGKIEIKEEEAQLIQGALEKINEQK